MNLCIDTYLCIHIYVYVYIYTHIYVYLYIYIYIVEAFESRPPRIGTHCNTLRHPSTHCNCNTLQLQHLTTPCNTLQTCNTLEYIATISDQIETRFQRRFDNRSMEHVLKSQFDTVIHTVNLSFICDDLQIHSI